MSHSPFRVLFVSHAYVVGVNQGKLHAIAQTGQVEVGLIAPSNWIAREWNRTFELETPYPDIRVYPVPVLFPGRGGACIYSLWHVWQALNDFNPDIIQVELEVFSLGAFEFALWSRLLRKPLAIFGWENMVERQLPLPRYWLSQFVLKTASLIIPGNRDGESLMRKWGYRGLLEVMPQIGVDPQFFASEKREAILQKRSQVECENIFKIGFLGRLVFSKGIDLIFSAIRQLREKGLNCQLILCGSGSDEAALRQEAQKQYIADWVVWKGSIRHHQAPEAMGEFDVLVLPSRTTSEWKEQFGHVLIEAMAMGIPVIGSSSGEIPNVIGRADLIFPEEDAQELAAILERMIRYPDWQKEAGHYGITRVNQNYTHECIAERLLILWRHMLHRQIGEQASNKKVSLLD